MWGIGFVLLFVGYVPLDGGDDQGGSVVLFIGGLMVCAALVLDVARWLRQR
jgi:hypothetical protein